MFSWAVNLHYSDELVNVNCVREFTKLKSKIILTPEGEAEARRI